MGVQDLIVLGAVELKPDTLVLGEGGKTSSWIQVVKPITAAKKGQRVFSITDNHIDQILTNAQAASTQIPIDYNHLSLEATLPEQGIAAGWFEDFKKENGNLFGLAEWTEPAAERIRKKEFRYISPTINFDARDEHGNSKGASLISAALTIYPFLKGMAPVTLTELLSQKIILADLSIDEKRSRLSQALRDKYPLDYPWLVDVFDDYMVFERGGKRWRLSYSMGNDFSVNFKGDPQEVVTQYEVIAATSQPPSSGAPMAGTNTGSEAVNQDILKLTEQVTTLSTAVDQLKQSNDSLKTAAEAEKERANKLELTLQTREAESAVDALVRARKVKVDDKAKWVKLYMSDKDMYNELIATLNPVIPALNKEHGSNAGDVEQLEDEGRGTKSAIALMEEKVQEYIGKHTVNGKAPRYAEAVRAVSLAEPKLAERYRAEFDSPEMVNA